MSTRRSRPAAACSASRSRTASRPWICRPSSTRAAGPPRCSYRLAQVVYTLTQFTTVKSVVFQIEGEDRDGLRRRGHHPRRARRRAPTSTTSCRRSSSTGRRTAPRWAIPGGSRATRTSSRRPSRSPSSTRAGKTLVDQPVMATCGTGCRGTFDVTLRYTVGKGQWGTLRAYNLSAMDGSPEDVREYPVWLTPAG